MPHIEHTKDVLATTEKIAMDQGICGDDRTMLKTAALFHDSGFLETNSDHEGISSKMERKWLPQFGYNKEQIEKICALILATKIPKAPKSELAEVLCDADLYYLGTDLPFIPGKKQALRSPKLLWQLIY